MDPVKKHDGMREDVKREFQLERMILFSDAVFAIVITLMAIEIRLPEHVGTEAPLDAGVFLHLLPVVAAYAVSFFFIGAIWYQHLRLFSVLNDYDKGLVVRNLVLLFLVGLFPFSASVITHAKGAEPAFVTYLSVIYACVLAQFALQHYVLVQRPNLRANVDLTEHRTALRRRKLIVLSMGVALILMLITLYATSGTPAAQMAVWWIMLMPVTLLVFGRKRGTAARVSK